MTVLIFCPTYRLEPETVRAIFEQDSRAPRDVLFTRDNPFGHSEGAANGLNIQYNLEKMRGLFLHGAYEAAWVVESDIIPPRDALSRLLKVDGDTVSGLYASRHGTPMPNALRAVEGGLQPLEWSEIQARWGETLETDGTCFGCLLIRRPVLEAVDFRYVSPNPPDWWWMLDVKRAGFSQVCDTSVVCSHKRPDGLIICPTRERIEYERAAPSWWETV